VRPDPSGRAIVMGRDSADLQVVRLEPVEAVIWLIATSMS
jgi:hypothetical protein